MPRARLAELLRRLGEFAAELGVVISVGGHVGDGNLHPVIAFDGADPGQVRSAGAVLDPHGILNPGKKY